MGDEKQIGHTGSARGFTVFLSIYPLFSPLSNASNLILLFQFKLLHLTHPEGTWRAVNILLSTSTLPIVV